ncbi:MAG: GH32 C-terminal domain-containing protein [Prevotella sp.]|nr:GH32 C-terminal domain-containing protein [Prevotella sp.]
MKLTKMLFSTLTATMWMQAVAQNPVARYDMTLTPEGSITEAITGRSYAVSSQLPVCSAVGFDGAALRFDGYSNYVKAGLPVAQLSADAMTISVTLAAETYPMMQVDVAETTPTFAVICGNLDEASKQGFALELSSQGDVRLRFGSASGFLMTVDGSEKLPRGQWNVLTAVLDKAANAATLYLNGQNIGKSRMSRAAIAHGTTDFFIGRSAQELKWGPFLINTFCGLIDDITIINEAVEPQLFTAAALPDFNYPASRYAASLWRPRFHGMPSGSWTNESHGMTYSNGRYHVFFQKNANGPYMSRLHWGHISSENLYDWTEEPIAIMPGASYDIKGCWSGCVYDDGQRHTILYTAVDNARATIAKAQATDSSLKHWEKQGIVIDGRPSGLSDDFRDPYYFKAHGREYIIVGTSKNGVGACTLHRLENGSWTNDGTIFFQGGSVSQHGSFWEMPNVTDMGDGRWLFTCTPLGTGVGVRTLCWVGTIDADGKFVVAQDSPGMQYLEMGGISRDGYGLLSPTIYQHDGKTLLLGIVPDKLPTEMNFEMGWAHCFSLPRELSLSADGQLVQKPYSGLTAMRTAITSQVSESLLGTRSLSPVSGRHIELLGEFTLASGTCGFNFLKWSQQQASLTYDVDRNSLTLDISSLGRQANDMGSYDAVYSTTLPTPLRAGEKLTLHVYFDGSIADIFVNDTWAFSVRIFTNNALAVDTEAFTTAQMQVNVQAWTLDPSQVAGSGIATVFRRQDSQSPCFNLQGRQLSGVLQKGFYIHNGRKYVGR